MAWYSTVGTYKCLTCIWNMLSMYLKYIFLGNILFIFSYFFKKYLPLKIRKNQGKFSFFDSNISKIGRDTRQSELPHWKWPLCGRGFTHFCGTACSLPQAVCRVANLRAKYAGISVPKLFCTGAPANWHAYTTRDAWSTRPFSDVLPYNTDPLNVVWESQEPSW